jgi:hypothetical protein
MWSRTVTRNMLLSPILRHRPMRPARRQPSPVQGPSDQDLAKLTSP